MLISETLYRPIERNDNISITQPDDQSPLFSIAKVPLSTDVFCTSVNQSEYRS